MPLSKNQTVTAEITAITNEGNGVARYEGKVIFVPGAAVGDMLEIKIVKDGKQFCYGKIESIVSPGDDRIAQDCPIGEICGGCCFRHLSYQAELTAKQQFVQDALQRIGHLDIDVLPILPSPSVQRYRNKVQYPVRAGKNGNIEYGFYAKRSHRVVYCEDCLLQPQIINQIAQQTITLLQKNNIPAYDEVSQTGNIRHLYFRIGHYTQEIMLCIVSSSGLVPNLDKLVSSLCASFPVITTVVLNVNPHNTNVILGDKNIPLYGNGTIQDYLCNVPLHLAPHSFSQVNTTGAERLFAVAKEYAAPKREDIILDLYCGAGVIGLSMAAQCKSLIGVEIVPSAVEAAKKSAAQMGLSNTRFILADAGKAAAQLEAEGLRPDIITVDPPRKGCDDATLEAILRMNPKKIVMVSCNPATMARDVAKLAAGGYTAHQVQPVDMFPRTNHVECVVELKKS
ncbi:MAG: 23S rRNA (uracil(1939)-C(5))-methyltransferase RlmD [Oscillospiraceae bacterium]